MQFLGIFGHMANNLFNALVHYTLLKKCCLNPPPPKKIWILKKYKRKGKHYVSKLICFWDINNTMRNPSVLCGTVNSIHRNGRESVAVHVDKTKDNSLINDISRVCVLAQEWIPWNALALEIDKMETWSFCLLKQSLSPSAMAPLLTYTPNNHIHDASMLLCIQLILVIAGSYITLSGVANPSE